MATVVALAFFAPVLRAEPARTSLSVQATVPRIGPTGVATPTPTPVSNTHVFTLPATTPVLTNGGGLDTGLSLTQGSRVHITAAGSTTYGLETGLTVGCNATGSGSARPNGDRWVGTTSCPRKIDPQCPLPTAPVGSVIARIGSGPWVLVGAAGDVRATRTGDLWLGYNDTLAGDNAGSYRVTVHVLP